MISWLKMCAKTVVRSVSHHCRTLTKRVSKSAERVAEPLMTERAVDLARVPITKLHKIAWLGSIPILMLVVAACGGNSQEPISDEPISARVIVTNVELSTDGDRVESITVRTDDGRELPMRLADDIDPAAWAPAHLQSHQGLGELGIKSVLLIYRPPKG